MANYARGVPISQEGGLMQEWPAPIPAGEQYNTTAAIASSVISLLPTSTQIEVGNFGGQGAVIRWIKTTETAAVSPFGSVISSGLAANFDHYIPAGVNRQFVIPRERAGAPTGQVGSLFGLYQRVAVAPAGASPTSILVAEYGNKDL